MPSSPAKTGVTVKGLNRQQTVETLQSLLQGMGLRYDFLYLPWNSERKSNIGLLFINFLDSQSAEHCIQRFALMETEHGGKLCRSACSSYVHGLASNLAFFLVSVGVKAIDDDHAPLVFDSLGRRMSLLWAVAQFVTMDLLISTDELWCRTQPRKRQRTTTTFSELGLSTMDVCQESLGGRRLPSQQFSGTEESEYLSAVKESGQKPGSEIPPRFSADLERSTVACSVSEVPQMGDADTSSTSGSSFSALKVPHRLGTGTSSTSGASSSVRCGLGEAEGSSDSTSQQHGKSMVKFTHIRVGDREITIVDF